MPNFSSTPGGPNDTPLAFWAVWELGSRPRRVALLMDDVQVDFHKCPFGSMLWVKHEHCGTNLVQTGQQHTVRAMIFPYIVAITVQLDQEEYRPYATGIIPNLVRLRDAFKVHRTRVVLSSHLIHHPALFKIRAGAL
jgi:hypothetical protein